MPGRKTDVKDAEWLADLLRHGLLTPSFIPPAPIRELRELTRAPFEPGGSARPRSQSGAEGAGRRQHQAGVCRHRWAGQEWAGDAGGAHRGTSRIPPAFRNWLWGACASFRPELQRALDGRMLGQHRILLQHLLAPIDFLDQSRAELEAEIERCLGARPM